MLAVPTYCSEADGYLAPKEICRLSRNAIQFLFYFNSLSALPNTGTQLSEMFFLFRIF